MDNSRGRVVSTASAEHYRWGPGCDGWHLVKTQDLSVIQERLPAGASEAPHHHTRAYQFFYVLSGTLTIEVDGDETQVNPGQGLAIPPGMRHVVQSRVGEATFLVVSAPPSHGDRVHDQA